MDLDKVFNETVVNIPPSGIRKFFDLASQMKDVISLGVGEPDFATPWKIRDAAIYSIEQGYTFYTANRGLIKLRQEVCDYYQRRFGVSYKPETDCLITVGGSEAIDITMRSILNPGDEVILLQPGYVAYIPGVELAGGKVVDIKLTQENEFKLTPEALKAAITPKTKAILLNYPCNPTGGIMTKEDLAKIVPILVENEIIVITDEIYAELTYGEQFCSIASFPEIKDQTVVISGFSKAFAMTGWRLGYVLAHPKMISMITKIHQYVIMSAPTAAQYGAIEGLASCQEDVDKMRKSYEIRRNLVVQELNDMGLETFLPRGAFYVFPSIKCTNMTSDEFCEKLLNEQKVACVPGTAFSKAGEGYIRVSYAYSLEQLKTALKRIRVFVEKYKI